MAQTDLIYFDIAAVVVMLVGLQSFLVRRKTRTPANRVYLSALLLVLATATFALAAETYDLVLGFAPTDAAYPSHARGLIQLIYYALRSLTAPAYFILIATVSDTTHRLNDRPLVRVLLWVPMLATLLFVLTNPIHHLVFTVHDGAIARNSGIFAIYLDALYYSLIGIGWLFRWKHVLSDDEFATLMMLYPIVLLSVFVQFYFPHLHVEMFATSVAVLMVASFVIRPERQMDSQVPAASLQAYRDLCHRAFLTGKPLCLVYLEVINLERLRDLVGKDKIQDILERVALNLGHSLEPGDILYYLRNGLFCISPVNRDVSHALQVANRMHEEGLRRSKQQPQQIAEMEMRTCVLSIPDDVSDEETLATFVRRLAHLVPDSRVTSFAQLAEQEDFALNMALAECVRRAIRERSFEVHYQPIWCPTHQCFHSAEALVRLHDPAFGYIPPALFIPEAEQNGSILAIGTILLEKICAFLSTVDFAATKLSYVEVNLSTEQCVRPQMARELLDLLDAYHIDPSRMNLEITESSATYSQRTVEANVRALNEAGLSFSLDDYGVGYSNTSRALALPFDLIKFDKSFVDGLGDANLHAVFARSIAMMKQIGKKVLVEGVETVEQADEVCAMGADYIQGYLYAKPLPEDEFVAFLLEHNA
jgi:EAL domain-containing protein (putative c-di-GMP-specific phosphodiesterase class I)/GGDEF domain-containing protein